jgi:hypothetical protein
MNKLSCRNGPLASCIIALAIFASAGCGARLGAVTGKVTCKGQVVASGSVVIVGSDLLPHHGLIEEDGTYTVPRVPTGPAKIAVFSPGPDQTFPPDPPNVRPEFKKKTTSPAFRGNPSKWFPIPEKYQDFDASALTLTVAGGVNELDISLD